MKAKKKSAPKLRAKTKVKPKAKAAVAERKPTVKAKPKSKTKSLAKPRLKPKPRISVATRPVPSRSLDIRPEVHGKPSPLVRELGRPITQLLKRWWVFIGGSLIIAFLFLGHFLSQPSPTRVPAAISEVAPTTELDTQFIEAGSMRPGDRVAFWSEILSAGTPNPQSMLASLGEGPAHADSAPWLPNRYNCTTFVETALALARSKGPADFFTHLRAIRYHQGKTDFFHRNHFPEADWIPNNVQAGVLADITDQVARVAQVSSLEVSKKIDRARWLNRLVKFHQISRDLASIADPKWAEAASVRVTYIPINDLQKVINHIPNGAIINVVRRSDPRHPVLISHQGVFVTRGQSATIRHSNVDGTMQAAPLLEYLNAQLARSQKQGWEILGINLNRLVNQD